MLDTSIRSALSDASASPAAFGSYHGDDIVIPTFAEIGRIPKSVLIEILTPTWTFRSVFDVKEVVSSSVRQ